ncbi:unnamed protein product [Orchesella dallaii]|uniref:Uncharacterized protein n=1 Tax=Orchesella dallaii TaxID=48710 RepID=A0ABP1PXU3_9HEXA
MAKNMSFSEQYFRHSGQVFGKLIPYSPCLTPLIILLDKSGMVALNYANIFLFTFCSLSTSQLLMFREVISDSITFNKKAFQTKSGIVSKAINWDNLREKLVLLCDMIQKAADYIAPLFLICHVRDLYDIVVNVLLVLSGRMGTEATAHTYASVVLLTFRLSLVIFYASNIDHTVKEIPKVFRDCPKDLYDMSTKRLQQFLESKPVGVFLFGTFRITRKFFISIISFIFTTEIILLQSSSAISNTSYKNL